MMSVLEYAEDINKTVEEVLNKCKELSIDARVEDDILSDEDIITLDNYFANIEEVIETEIAKDKENLENAKKELVDTATDTAKTTITSAKEIKEEVIKVVEE